MRLVHAITMVAMGTALRLASPLPAAACSLNAVPWQAGSVWPPKDAVAPLNVRIQVAIPADPVRGLTPTLRVSTRPGSLLPEKIDESSAHPERALSLFALTADGQLGEEVVTERRILEQGGASPLRRFELAPLTPLRPESSYAVVLRTDQGSERLGEVRTGKEIDRAPPVWPGVQTARFAPPVRRWQSWGECPEAPQGPRAILQIHPPRDDAQLPVQFLVWVQRAAVRIDFTRPPHARLFADKDRLTVADFPQHSATVRVGVRALDAAGNLSPPSEIDVEIEKGP